MNIGNARHRRGSVVVAYALFVLIGLSAAAPTVLLVAQMDDYGVGRAAIGLTFFTFSAGFVLAGATAGPLIHRWGTRLTLLAGALAFVVAGLATATRPMFWLFVALQIVAGYGGGLMESVLNAHLAAMPRSTTLLNRLHAFFGVGALAAPASAAWLLHYVEWPRVILALTLVGLPVFVAIWFTYPDRAADPLAATGHTGAPSDATAGVDGAAGAVGSLGSAGSAGSAGLAGSAGDATGSAVAAKEPGLLASVLRTPAVLLGAVLLTVYVGLEVGVGNWGFGYLIEEQAAPNAAASWIMSGYWLGLTAGRFVLSPLATRLRLTKIGLLYVSIFGVIASVALGWAAPTVGLAAAGFALLGFFLGPIFPTIMAVAPDLTSPRLAPTAIGVINAGSVVGGSGLPWLAGALGQGLGIWTLLPFALLLAVVQLLVLWRMVRRMSLPVSQPLVAAGHSPAAG